MAGARVLASCQSPPAIGPTLLGPSRAWKDQFLPEGSTLVVVGGVSKVGGPPATRVGNLHLVHYGCDLSASERPERGPNAIYITSPF